MMVVPLLHQPTGLLALLGESALRSIAVAGIAAIAIALHSPRRAEVRLQVWSGVLFIALMMPLLGIVLPKMNVRISQPASLHARIGHQTAQPAASPATPLAPAGPIVENESAFAESDVAHPVKQRRVSPPDVSTSALKSYSGPAAGLATPRSVPDEQMPAWRSRIKWSYLALAIYFLGLATLALRLLLGFAASRRLARTANEVSRRYFLRKGEAEDVDSAALDFLAQQAKLAGLKTVPRIRESSVLLVPATVGIRKPLILLPAGWREWNRDKFKAVLSHEISHVARRDAFTQLLSRMHCAVFWFSPLPWWLHRQITELAEQASDEAALASGADRKLYAETLLGFFEQLQSVRGRVRWHAVSMASQSSSGPAERRVDRILAWKASASFKKSLMVVTLTCATPVILLAASLRPSFNAEVLSVATSSESPTKKFLPVIYASSPNAEEAAQQKDEPSEDRSKTVAIHGRSFGGDSGPRYVYIQANSDEVTMSGDEEDVQHARRLRGKINGDFIWFQRDEKSYVITDPQFLTRVKALFEPQDELSRQQDALGRQQHELGRQQDSLGLQQDELGKKMDEVSVKVPDISPDLERIHARLKQLQATGATQSELGSVQSQIGELQSRLGRLQSQAGQQQSVVGGQQSELGRKQSELGRKQSELGKQQAALGQQQSELARKASRELRNMFDDAISKGTAKPE
jgi:beta-lactamase regulating signal transducer with metallopeptidase domain